MNILKKCMNSGKTHSGFFGIAGLSVRGFRFNLFMLFGALGNGPIAHMSLAPFQVLPQSRLKTVSSVIHVSTRFL